MHIALDTTQQHGSIALAENGVLLYSAWLDIRITHSETLMPELDHALKLCHKSPRSIKAIHLCNGPGSFTGLRIGLATAKGIAYANKIPVYTYSSLELCGINLYACGRDILVVIDAKMNEIYAAKYDQYLSELLPPTVMKPEDIAQYADGECFLLGSGSELVLATLAQNGISCIRVLPYQERMNAAGLFALHCIKKTSLEYDYQVLAELEPMYLRESTAQIRKKKNEQHR